MPGPVAASVLRDSVERLDGAIPAESDHCPNSHGLPTPTLGEHKRYSGVLQHGHKERSWNAARRPGKPGNAPECRDYAAGSRNPRWRARAWLLRSEPNEKRRQEIPERKLSFSRA